MKKSIQLLIASALISCTWQSKAQVADRGQAIGTTSEVQSAVPGNPTPMSVTTIPVLPTQGNEFCAVSHYPYVTEMVQPNNDSFKGLMLTVAKMTYLETLDGYTVMQDPTDAYFKYVAQGVDGDLYLTNVKVSDINKRSKQETLTLNALNKNARYEGEPLRNRIAILNAAQIPPGLSLQNVFPSFGIQKALLLLIDYPDQAATYTSAAFYNLSNQVGYNVNGQTGSFRDFYLAASYGNLTINTDVAGWFTAINNRATYGVDDINNRNFYNAVPLIREAVDAAEAAGIDFSIYDGDNDGAVDVVMVIHSGRGAEESGNAGDIWSHRWVLSALGLQVTYDGKYIDDYIVQAEKLGTTTITNIGVMCHEFGHALGLPDLYDTDGGSEGLGNWCLMAGGTWNNNGRTPAHPSVYCKDEMGWMVPTVLSGSGTISNMDYSQSSPAAFRLNSLVGPQYFLIENRQQFVWDSFLPGAGLCIYHVDRSIGDNTNPNRYRVNLEQADGLRNLNLGQNRGDAGDTFPGSTNNTTFNCASNPNSNTYNGNASTANISGIVAQAGNKMGFVYFTAVSFTAPASPICLNEILSGQGGGTPTGGIYSGPGVTDDGNGTTYTFNAGTAGNGTHTISYTLTDVSGCAVSAADTVTVGDLIAPIVSCPIDQTVYLGAGNPFYFVPDYFGTGEATAMDNCTNPVIITSQIPAAGTPLADGVFTITLTATDANGNVGSCDFELTVETILGIGNTALSLETITLNPVPTKDILNISNPQHIALEKLEIYDTSGRLVQLSDLRGMGPVMAIDVNQLAAATYYIKIIGKYGTITKRLIKE